MADLLTDELVVADDPAAWEGLGFDVADGACQVGTVRFRLAGSGAGRGLTEWSIRGLAPDADPDGLPVTPSDAPARLWGLAFVTEDIDRTTGRIGDHVSGPRDAVQPGRKIATLRRGAGLAVPIAFMTPR